MEIGTPTLTRNIYSLSLSLFAVCAPIRSFGTLDDGFESMGSQYSKFNADVKDIDHFRLSSAELL
jgi:hypothetical protein